MKVILISHFTIFYNYIFIKMIFNVYILFVRIIKLKNKNKEIYKNDLIIFKYKFKIFKIVKLWKYNN